VVSDRSSQAADPVADAGFQRAGLSPAERRQMMISEYGEWLRTQTNRHGRPFQAESISAYRDAAVALSSWMTSVGLEADFTRCDTAALNRFFRAYLAAHSQGGTNTKQRNLRHLFTWLASEYGHPHPYSDALLRYAPVKVRPSTLAADFIRDLLTVTGDGRARGFHDARDHAMIRMLTEGVRRAELVQIRLDDLAADLIARPCIRAVPLKGRGRPTRGASCR
jgi:integrase/recombinase XerD